MKRRLARLALLLVMLATACLRLGGCSLAPRRAASLAAPLRALLRLLFDENRLLVAFFHAGNETAVDAVDEDSEAVQDAFGEAVLGLQVGVVSGPGPPSERQRHPPGDLYLHGRAHGFLVVAGDAEDSAWTWVPSLRPLPWWNSSALFLVVTRADPETAFAALAAQFVDNVVLVSTEPGNVAAFAVHALAEQAECSRVRVGRAVRVASWRGTRWSPDDAVPSDAVLDALAARRWTPLVAGCRVRAIVTENVRHLSTDIISAVTREMRAQVDVSVAGIVGNERLPDGRWTGLLGAVQRNDADVALVLLPTVERSEHFRLSAMLSTIRIGVVLRCPSGGAAVSSSSSGAGLMHLFRHQRIVLLLTATLLAYFLSVLAGRRVDLLARGGRASSPGPREPALGVGAFEIVATLMEQPVGPRFSVQRRLFGQMLLFALIVNMYLKSAITAELSSTPSGERIKTLHELSRRGAGLGISAAILLSNLKNAARSVPELRDLAARAHTCVSNATECVARFKVARASTYALSFSELSPLRKRITDLGLCTYRLQEALEYSQIMMFTRLDDPLGPPLDAAIMQLQSTGLIPHWLKNMYPERTVDKDDKETATSSLQQTVVAVIVLGVGQLVAALVFAVEVVSVYLLDGAGRRVRRGGPGRGLGHALGHPANVILGMSDFKGLARRSHVDSYSRWPSATSSRPRRTYGRHAGVGLASSERRRGDPPVAARSVPPPAEAK